MLNMHRQAPRRSVLVPVAALGMVLLAGGCRDYTTVPLREEAMAQPAGPRIRFAQANLPAVSIAPGQHRQIGSVLNVPEAMRYGEFVWNDAGVPDGRTWILVDLKAQTLSVFRGQDEIGTAVTLYGVDEKPTPTGRFTVLAKSKDHWSSLYDAPMPYTLRLTDDGVAIHGSDVRDGAGTHGCLGVPLDFASELFKHVPVGAEVVILRDAALSIAPNMRTRSGDLS